MIKHNLSNFHVKWHRFIHVILCMTNRLLFAKVLQRKPLISFSLLLKATTLHSTPRVPLPFPTHSLSVILLPKKWANEMGHWVWAPANKFYT